MTLRLPDLARCFEGILPSHLATCALDGEPNVTYLSQVHYLDPKHVALSCQFFNKTKRNVLENPLAMLLMYDPVTFEAYRLRLRYDHAETEGPLFERMAARIDVIASHTGMTGVFKLISADVFEVLSLEKIEGFLAPPDPVLDALPQKAVNGPLTELRSLQVVSDRIARARDMDELLFGALTALDELLGFSHAMILLADEDAQRLTPTASRGYGGTPGEHKVCPKSAASLAFGEGLVGTVAQRRRMVRVAGMGSELRYGRAIRDRAAAAGHVHPLAPEVPLPGLEDAQAQLGLPLFAGERLVGVLAVESRDPLCFDEWDEAFLQIVGNQIAAGIERVRSEAPTPASAPAVSASPAAPAANGAPVKRFTFYKNDDCVFVDREYLVRNLPGRILWKLLRAFEREGRTEFTNRELRLDPTLGLPPIKDNLESRLILLRKRLAEKCPEARLVPNGRGRFTLELDCVPELVEQETG